MTAGVAAAGKGAAETGGGAGTADGGGNDATTFAGAGSEGGGGAEAERGIIVAGGMVATVGENSVSLTVEGRGRISTTGSNTGTSSVDSATFAAASVYGASA